MIDIRFRHGSKQFSLYFLCEGKIDFYIDGNVIIDPSFLRVLMLYELNYEFMKEVKFYIPDKLYDLIIKAKENEEYKNFLARLLAYFSYHPYRRFSKLEWERFFNNYNFLIEKEMLFKITEKDIDGKLHHFCLETFKNHSFYISMSPKINFLGDILGKILGFSKKSGAIIFMKTRKLVNLVREKVITLELPKKLLEKLDEFVDLKQEIFDFKGRKFAKFFIAVVVAVHHRNHGLGLALAIMDP